MTKLIFTLLLFVTLNHSCSSRLNRASSRSLGGGSDEKSGLHKHLGRPVLREDIEEDKPLEISIEKISSNPLVGSQVNLDNRYLDLFSKRRGYMPGDLIDVKVETTGDLSSQEPGKVEGGGDLTDLFERFPELKPADAASKIPQSLQMKIVDTRPDGDLIVEYVRRSKAKKSVQEVYAQAVLSTLDLQTGDTVSTKDLRDVVIRDRKGEEEIEKRSTQWEDEYTLRVAGFTEEKSEEAQKIRAARKSLSKSLANLKKNKKEVGQERQKISKERKESREERAKNKEIVQGLEEKLKKQKEDGDERAKNLSDTIEKQKKEIGDLRKELIDMKKEAQARSDVEENTTLP